MTAAAQPDLFGESDAREAMAVEWAKPATCPACGTTERNGHILRLNHGAEPGKPGICGFPAGKHPNYGAMCVAQSLVSSHIWGDAKHGRPALDRSIIRGRELGLDVEAIVLAGLEATA